MVVRYVVAACAGVLIAASPARANKGLLEEIKGSDVNSSGVGITVATGGCTKKEDFQVVTHPAAGGATDVEFKRLHPDRCKGFFPDGIQLQFSWTDLQVPAGTKLTVKNPVSPKKVGADTIAAPDERAQNGSSDKKDVSAVKGAEKQVKPATSTKRVKTVKPRKRAVRRCLRSKYRKHGCVTRSAHRVNTSTRRVHRVHRRHRHYRVRRMYRHRCCCD